MPSRRRALAFAVLILLLGGCEPVLETGYKPRPLNASEADRRSYYAPAFSADSQPDKGGTGFNFAP